MRIHILDQNNYMIEITGEMSEAEARETLHHTTSDSHEEHEDFIVETYKHYQNCPHHDEDMPELIGCCLHHWSTSPNILISFSNNAKTKDGFVRIGHEDVETGWMERRYH